MRGYKCFIADLAAIPLRIFGLQPETALKPNYINPNTRTAVNVVNRAATPPFAANQTLSVLQLVIKFIKFLHEPFQCKVLLLRTPVDPILSGETLENDKLILL